MQDKPGFVIHGEFYASPTAFRLGDPVLVSELTGMKFPDFALALDAQEDGDSLDPVLLAGLIGVSVWQRFPKWPRARVVGFVQTLDLASIGFTAPEEEDESPPARAELGENSLSLATSSSTSPDTTAETLNPNSHGQPGSDTTSPESLQAA